MKPKLTYTREPVYTVDENAVKLDKVAIMMAQLNESDRLTISREGVSGAIGKIGLTSFTRGSHVAIHSSIHSPRLAIITGNFGDWI